MPLAPVAAIAGAAFGWALARRGKRRSPKPDHTPVPPVAVASDPPDITVSHVRSDEEFIDGLLHGLITSHDLATDDAQRAHILRTLRRAGVAHVAPDPGDAFDPERTMAIGTESAPSPDKAGRIARTERPGWQHDSQLLRPAEVIVWQ